MAKFYKAEPMGSWILITLHKEAEKTTPGGILLPQQAVPKANSATVLAVGPGAVNLDGGDRIPVGVTQSGQPLQPGDLILVNPAGPRTYELPNGEKVSLVNEGDVLAKLVPVEEED